MGKPRLSLIAAWLPGTASMHHPDKSPGGTIRIAGGDSDSCGFLALPDKS